MKKNTGCGPSRHHHCPPAPAANFAKSQSFGGAPEQIDIPEPTIPAEEFAFERTVILGDFILPIPTEAEIKLPTYATHIKEIRKNVHLTQCKVTHVTETEEGAFTATLFVEGYVHKNIQYTESNSRYLSDYSVNVPFKSYQMVEFVIPPVVPAVSNKNSTNNEIRELAKNGMEADRCNFGSTTFEEFNEPIHCKIIRSTVNQWDILHNHDNWGRFNKITEKMRVDVRVRLTQKQVAVDENGGEG